MRSASRCGWCVVVLFVVGTLIGVGISGCSPPPDKKKTPTKTTAPEKRIVKEKEKSDVKPEEPVAKPEEPTVTEEPAPKTEEPTPKTEEPAPKTEEPAPKTEEPAPKMEEPAPKMEEPAPKPEEPVAKPEEPGAKPEEPAAKSDATMKEEPAPKTEEPAAKPEEPAKAEEPSAKPEEPAAAEKPAAGEGAAESADSPKVSAFAPAEDLVNQVGDYVKGLEEAVASEQQYKDSVDKIAKDANTLILVALALGLHDQDNKYKSAAPALVKASQELAAAKDFEATKKGVEAVKAAAAGEVKGEAALKWEKVASLPELMKQVPLINTKLKRYVTGARFKKRAKDTAGWSAVIAVIGQGSIANTENAKNEDQVKQWRDFCILMRDAAGEVNAGIHKADEAATGAAMKKLAKSCDDCHAVFHPVDPSKLDVGSEDEK